MRLPSGLNAALNTVSSWPLRTSRSRKLRQAPSSCNSDSFHRPPAGAPRRGAWPPLLNRPRPPFGTPWKKSSRPGPKEGRAPAPRASGGRARRRGIKQITLRSDPFDAASRTCNHSTARHACMGHDAAPLTSWRPTAHSRARKSSRARTDGSSPRRDGNTAWTMPLRGCHCGRT